MTRITRNAHGIFYGGCSMGDILHGIFYEGCSTWNILHGMFYEGYLGRTSLVENPL
jgi:hypothetical protein